MTRTSKYLILATIVFVTLINSLFVVDQRKRALVLQFGEVIKSIDKAGLKFKIPFVQNVILFDNRILDLGIKESEVTSLDKKRLIIDAFAKYKIVDPKKFYVTVNNEYNARERLMIILDSSLRRIVGEVQIIKLLSEERSAIMSKIKIEIAKEAEDFGIEIVDVRIVRSDLPKENSSAIFSRMRAEREKEAREIRATGFEEAEKIKASADKESVVLLANAKKQANIARGEGDAKANRIFANAFSRDPQFFDFYRSMQAYEKSLSNTDKTRMVISPDSNFFKFLGN